MKRRCGRWLWLWSLALVWGAGCRGPQPAPLGERSYPADFALEMTVEAVTFASGSDPLRYPSRYVLEPNRVLRVALGPGVHAGLHPPPTATLSPDEMAEVYRRIERGGLMEEGEGQAASAPAGDVVYRLAITADGRTRRFTTTPEASPAAVSLLERLVALRSK